MTPVLYTLPAVLAAVVALPVPAQASAGPTCDVTLVSDPVPTQPPFVTGVLAAYGVVEAPGAWTFVAYRCWVAPVAAASWHLLEVSASGLGPRVVVAGADHDRWPDVYSLVQCEETAVSTPSSVLVSRWCRDL